MAAVLEHISNYKGEDILVWREDGIRSFSYGNQKYNSISEAREVIDSIYDPPDWDGADDCI